VKAADALLQAPPVRHGDLGVEVQALTSSLSVASGAEAGVMVSWVDPKGAAGDLLWPGDVITAMDGVTMTSPEQWQVRAARVQPTQMVMIDVMRRGAPLNVALTALQPADVATPAALGLTLRSVARVGTEVVRVDPHSAAATAGIQAGDVITRIGATEAPTPARIRAAFAGAQQGELLLVALARGASHLVVALPR
jgi:S1-C subfamily serine protease